MNIISVTPVVPYKLLIELDNGITGTFDVSPYLTLEAFAILSSFEEFKKIINGKYYIEWECGADLSVDTIEAHLT
jgi:hypothetical protein